MRNDKIEILTYNPHFKDLFEQEAEKLHAIFGKLCNQIYHTGSTSIPGLWARPIIDILLVSTRFLPIDTKNDAMKDLGYIPHGEYGIPMSRFFTKREGAIHYNVYAYVIGSPEISRALLFQDYLITHPESGNAYSRLKKELAAQFPYDLDAYVKGKLAFIRAIEAAAGYQENNIQFVHTDEQWKEFHAIRKKHLFDKYDKSYSTDDLKLEDSAHAYFMLYQGTTTVGIAHLIRMDEETTMVHSFIIDQYPQEHEDFEYALPFFRLLEKWAFCQGSPTINIVRTPENNDFILYAGFTELKK